MFPSDAAGMPVLEARVAELCGTINVATAALVDVVVGVMAAPRGSRARRR